MAITGEGAGTSAGAAVGADNQEHWSGKAAFVFAAVGSAVGLGNLWRFPYQAGENGGGAFVIVYVLCVLAIGLPVLSAELFLGRRGGGSAIAAIRRLAAAEGASSAWTVFAWVGMIASFLIVTFYSVIAGWVLYFALILIGDLYGSIADQGMAGLFGGAFYGKEQAEIEGQLGGLISSPGKMILFHAIFMGLTTWIVSRGIKGGIEAAVKILMPAFFVLLVVLAGFALVRGDASAAFAFLFQPDFETLAARFADGSILLSAIGQAFFSLSLGSALMITYGLYISRGQSIPQSAGIVAGADTAVALIAGLAIFPIVFQFGLTPGAGPGLMFGTLPLGFSQMPLGSLFGIAFFLMAFFAALTSSISLLEVATAWADGDVTVDPEDRRRRRVIGSLILGGIAFLIGIAHALSQVPLSVGDYVFNSWVPAPGIALFEGDTLLDFTDKLTGSVLLPFGGLMTSIFAGWAVSRAASREELGFATERRYRIWRFLVRWICPIFVGAVLFWGAIFAPLFGQS